MKKTITTALLCLGLATAALASDYTLTTTLTNYTADHSGGMSGWTSTLTSSVLSLSPADTLLTEKVTLDTIKLTCPINNFNSGADVKLAVAVVGADGSLDFKGITETATHLAQGGTATFTFDSIELDTTTQYHFFYMDTTATSASFEGISTVAELQATGLQETLRQRLFKAPTGTTLTDIGVLSGAGLTVNNAYVVNATYEVSKVVPEPATATLSLLALAGLAARRRRK